MAETTKKGRVSKKTLMLVQTAVLAAILILLDRTGLGYFKIGIFSLTIMTVPMIIGSVTIGKTAGAVLGGIFGLTIIFLPETMFFMNINLPATLILIVGMRGLVLGFLGGLLFQIFSKVDKSGVWSYGAAGLSVSLLNTLITMGGIAVIFGSDPAVRGAFGFEGTGIFAFFLFICTAVALQAAIEALICTVAAGAVAKALNVYLKKL